MSLWSKLGWLLKHLDHLKTHSVSRIWCWIMRSFKNDQALIQFWINCWLQSRLTLKHGWRLTDNGWAPVPHRTGALGAPFCVTYLKQWVPYHSTAWDKNTVADWRISVELLNSCSHREQGLWKEPFCETHKAVGFQSYHWRRRILVLSNELFIITLLAWVMARRTRMVG